MPEKPLILYVEDNELNRTLMKRVLEYRGYRVEMAEDGPTGFAAARALRPALILMDLGIPGTDGFETTRLIKHDPETRHIPVIAVTAFAMRGDRERALEAGCDGYLTKPIDVAALPREIDRYIAAAAAGRETREDPSGSKAPVGTGG